MAVTALPSGRRVSSPPPQQIPPTNGTIRRSSSQHSVVSTTNDNINAAPRLSDAISAMLGRTRTHSLDSNARSLINSKHSEKQVQDDTTVDSSFGIDPDPFSSRPGTSSIRNSQSTNIPPSTIGHHSNNNPVQRKQRGSFLFAASDVLGLGRVSASISKRMSKRSSTDHSATLPTSQAQQTKGVSWKGKGKPKGHWALQPSSSSHLISDVIEISAAKSGLTSVRNEEEENERRERDRLREAAAESIGISPLFREDASSRIAESDDVHYDDEPGGELETRHHDACRDVDSAGTLRVLDNSRTNINDIIKQQDKPVESIAQQARETKHNRSSSLSGIATPTTPSSTSHWPLPPIVTASLSTNGRTAKGYVTANTSQQLAPFPCLLSELDRVLSKSSSLLKFFPPSPLLRLGFTRQWKARTIVLTVPPRSISPSLTSFGIRPFSSSDRLPTVYHLHLFKSSRLDERELERLEVNEASVVFVAEEEIAGKRSVVKVGGVDVGAKKRELNVEENGHTMWLLSIPDAHEAQEWITILKGAVLNQRAEKAGFAMPTSSASASGPKGDLDVMLSLRAQDVASTVRAQSQMSSRNSHDDRARNSESPTPTTRSWSSERRRPTSPSGRMVSLKGLFSVPGRVRSMSQAVTTRSDEDTPTTPVDAPSFASRGTTLLNMIRAPNGTAAPGPTEMDSKSAPSSPALPSQSMPVPIPDPGPILSKAEMNLDKVSLKERDREVPDWYTLQNHQRSKGDSSPQNTGSALLPPPRYRRPWTSVGLLSNNVKQEQVAEGSPPSRRSFQSAISLHGARLSIDGKSRPSSPVDSLGIATGALGIAEVGSKRASLSSSISSFVSMAPDRDQLTARSNSSIQRRMRAGKLPKMLAPPAGPPPSAPQPTRGSSSSEDPNSRALSDRPPSRSSSVRSLSNSDAFQNGDIATARRLSDSSAFSTGTAGTFASRGNYSSFRKSSNSSSLKRTSIPPPPRPAPTSALPPTPPEASPLVQKDTSPRRSFRESFSHRSLRFSLSPQLTKGTPRSEEALRRRSVSIGGSAQSSKSLIAPTITIAPPAPPPTGPLPPTPRDPVPNRYSIRERLRMKSAPSTPPLGVLRGTGGPPTTLPGSPPLVTVESVASLRGDNEAPIPIGEPITAIPKDLNFLSMSSPIDSSAPSTDDTDFLNMTSPVATTFPKQIPGKTSDYPPLEHPNGSPPTPEMTALPPPPRRGRNGTISEKDKDRNSQSLANNVAPTTTADDISTVNAQLEPVAAM